MNLREYAPPDEKLFFGQHQVVWEIANGPQSFSSTIEEHYKPEKKTWSEVDYTDEG